MLISWFLMKEIWINNLCSVHRSRRSMFLLFIVYAGMYMGPNLHNSNNIISVNLQLAGIANYQYRSILFYNDDKLGNKRN